MQSTFVFTQISTNRLRGKMTQNVGFEGGFADCVSPNWLPEKGLGQVFTPLVLWRTPRVFSMRWGDCRNGVRAPPRAHSSKTRMVGDKDAVTKEATTPEAEGLA